MNKYITDTINNLKSVISKLSKPEQKAVTEIVRGLFKEGTPILRHLAQNPEISVKKQGEKYGHHLGKIDLVKSAESVALKHAKLQVRKHTIISYDLSDINKECATKMGKLRRVFDGSKRKTTNGYCFHGVGINQILVKAELHDGDKTFLPQIRKKIVTEISKKLEENGKKRGIWVLDRGNDDKQFFHFLRSDLNVNFIVRLKENRQVVLAKNGVLKKVKNLKKGQYDVYFLNRSNNKIEDNYSYRLVIYQHLKDKDPIRLLTTLPKKRFSMGQIVTMYLERWGIENSFKRIKQKFGLEKIRVLKYQSLLNLVALTLFTFAISTVIFQRIQKLNNLLIAETLLTYKDFLKRYSLSQNLDSFISFLKSAIPTFVHRNHSPPNQLSLFPKIIAEKLGSF